MEPGSTTVGEPHTLGLGLRVQGDYALNPKPIGLPRNGVFSAALGLRSKAPSLGFRV